MELSLEQINEIYIDVLKEIGNIGAGNATTALSNMLGLKIDMQVPKVQILTFQELPCAISYEEDPIVGIYLEVGADISGSIMFLIKEESAYHLVSKLMGVPDEFKGEFTEMELSALKEIGNIIAASYLSAIAGLTNMTITPSIPYISIDMAGAILSVPAIQFGQYGDNALLIQTQFGDEVDIDGYFILVPDADSQGKILASLGVNL
jgi:chemotaxis protein CheC